MKETIAEDLMKNRFHPKHMDKWFSWGQEEEDDFKIVMYLLLFIYFFAMILYIYIYILLFLYGFRATTSNHYYLNCL